MRRKWSGLGRSRLLPATSAASRSCITFAGISPSTYRTRQGIGAFHLRNDSPEATANAMPSAV
jgi:hypothetical protein